MGGYGSGNWCRWSKKDTTEDCKKIDIRFMKRKGWLRPGTGGSLTWKWNGEPWGDIRFLCNHDSLKLVYRYRAGGSDWEPVEQLVPVTTTPCNYGGSRQWFSCPHCHRRCAILYSASKLFLCRKCYDLPYTSQEQSNIDRLIAQKHKLGERIFEVYEYGDGWMKKKGMHWKTFDRLHLKYQRLDAGILQGMYARFGDELLDY